MPQHRNPEPQSNPLAFPRRGELDLVRVLHGETVKVAVTAPSSLPRPFPLESARSSRPNHALHFG
jgi:hypothetical protein